MYTPLDCFFRGDMMSSVALYRTALAVLLNKDDFKEIKIGLFIFGTLITALFLVTILVASTTMFAIINTFHTDISKLGGEPTTYAVKEIGESLQMFRQAQSKYEVSWAVLAGIASIESGFGKSDYYVSKKGVSEAGAVGYMQFMPLTWSGWSNPNAKNDPKWQPSVFPPSPETPGLPYDTNPSRIEQYGGYGVDGDGDGYADPYNPIDAIYSAAKYIKANLDVNNGDYEKALFHYNHDKSYVSSVLAKAESYQEYQLPNIAGLWPLNQHYHITALFKQKYTSFDEGDVLLWPLCHTGIDIGCPEGTPLYAIIAGRISFAGFAPGYGGLVQIDDGNGTVVRYAHLSKSIIRQGDYVEQGDLIAYSGDTGRSTGPHLHLELLVNGQLSNPLDWLCPPGEPGVQNY